MHPYHNPPLLSYHSRGYAICVTPPHPAPAAPTSHLQRMDSSRPGSPAPVRSEGPHTRLPTPHTCTAAPDPTHLRVEAVQLRLAGDRQGIEEVDVVLWGRNPRRGGSGNGWEDARSVQQSEFEFQFELGRSHLPCHASSPMSFKAPPHPTSLTRHKGLLDPQYFSSPCRPLRMPKRCWRGPAGSAAGSPHYGRHLRPAAPAARSVA